MADDDQPVAALPKPDALLALHDVTEQLFATLREWFDVPESVTVDLRAVDSAVAELGEPRMIMAMAMRKLQALHLLATPGVMTTTDVVVTIVQDLDRALVQAPNMHLKRQAASTDWDAALVELEATGGEDEGSSHEPTDSDPEVAAFRLLHARLHEALYAVVEASDGEVRFFV
jgi:hypothetical protein